MAAVIFLCKRRALMRRDGRRATCRCAILRAASRVCLARRERWASVGAPPRTRTLQGVSLGRDHLAHRAGCRCGVRARQVCKTFASPAAAPCWHVDVTFAGPPVTFALQGRNAKNIFMRVTVDAREMWPEIACNVAECAVKFSAIAAVSAAVNSTSDCIMSSFSTFVFVAHHVFVGCASGPCGSCLRESFLPPSYTGGQR